MTGNFSGNEMMIIAAARALKNEDVVFVGIGAPSEACSLARLTHAPDISLVYESGTIGSTPDSLPTSVGDPALCETAIATVPSLELFNYWLQGGRISVGMLGAEQLDKYANMNSSAIGDYRQPATRLTGGGAAPDIATWCGEVHVVMPQSERCLVDRLEFLTIFGFGNGGMDRMARGIQTKGPTMLVTDLAIWTPDIFSKELTVTALQPGVHRDVVEDTCGWKVRFARQVDDVPPPTAQELEVLRDLRTRSDAALYDENAATA